MVNPFFGVNAGAAPAPVESTVPTPPADRELREAAEEFESLLLNMMMKSMRQSVPENDLFGDGSKVRMYEEMRDTELARLMAQRGGIGLARLIVEQFQGQEEAGLAALRGAGREMREAEASYRAHSQLAETGVLAAPQPIHSEEESP